MVLLASARVQWQGQAALLISGIDMTHLDEVQHQLVESERNYRRLFEKMQDVYYRTDAQGVVQQVGPAVRRVLGYEPHQIVGRTAESYYPQSRDRDAFKQAIQTLGEVSDFPGQMVRSDGQVIDISISSHALFDHNGQFAGVEGIYRDVTQRKNLERELQRLASTDMLTGLSNRRVLLEAAESLFLGSRQGDATRSPGTPALLMLDLDHFKTINDHYGHLEGDRALVEFAAVVRRIARQRPGGAHGARNSPCCCPIPAAPKPRPWPSASCSACASARCGTAARAAAPPQRQHRPGLPPARRPPAARLAGTRRPGPVPGQAPGARPGGGGRLRHAPRLPWQARHRPQRAGSCHPRRRPGQGPNPPVRHPMRSANS
jgi:PAS domain S-box-containing protein